MKLLLCFATAAFLHTPLFAQDTTTANGASKAPTAAKLYRDPHKARILGSVLPGAGHVYSGEYLLGYGYYVATVGGVVMGATVFIVNRCGFSFLSTSCSDPGPEWPHQALGIAMIGGGIWIWISSARDAPHAAERANARHPARAFSVKPLIQPFNDPRRTLGAGLSVTW